MSTQTLWTVQVGTTLYQANVLTIEAASAEEACERAIEVANTADGWKNIDHCGPTFVDALAPGDAYSPWNAHAATSVLPVPGPYLEGGEERRAACESHAFVTRVAAYLTSPPWPRRSRRSGRDADRLDLLNALIAEARTIRERNGLIPPDAEA